jgi:hypothetical protein
MKRAILITSIAIIFMFPVIAAATIIVDTGTPAGLGGGPTLDSGTGNIWGFGIQFTLAQPYDLTSIKSYMDPKLSDITPVPIIVSLYGNSGGVPDPASVYFSGGTTVNSSGWQGLNGINTGMLNIGTYWAAFQFDPSIVPTSGPYYDLIFPVIVSNPSPAHAALQNGVWAPFNTSVPGVGGGMGLQIEGNLVAPVPEPTTMLLLGSGLVGLAGYGRKKFFKK